MEEARKKIGVSSLEELGEEHLPKINELKRKHFDEKLFKVPELRVSKAQRLLKKLVKENMAKKKR